MEERVVQVIITRGREKGKIFLTLACLAFLFILFYSLIWFHSPYNIHFISCFFRFLFGLIKFAVALSFVLSLHCQNKHEFSYLLNSCVIRSFYFVSALCPCFNHFNFLNPSEVDLLGYVVSICC